MPLHANETKALNGIQTEDITLLLNVTMEQNISDFTYVEKKLTIPTERPPLVGEVSAKFCG
jgi:hypothetical protein